MKPHRLGIFLYALLYIIFSQPSFAAKEPMKTTDKPVGLFDGSHLWEEYKRVSERIGKAKSVKAVRRISEKGSDLLNQMTDELTAYEDTVDDLSVIFVARINSRLDAVSTNYGKRPRPIYVKLLRHRLKTFQAEIRLVDTFLQHDVKDPWAYAVIYEFMTDSRRALIFYIENIDKEVQSQITVLTDEDKKDIADATTAIAHAKVLIEEKEKRGL